MIEHSYLFAGTSLHEGVVTYRFANNVARMKVLERNGHRDVSFMELPRAMTLREAVAFLNANGIVAQLPYGQRKVQNGKRSDTAKVAVAAEQHDAHVLAHEAELLAREERAAAARERKNAARRAARAAARDRRPACPPGAL